MPPDRAIFELSEKPDNYYRAPRVEMLKYIPLDARRILDVGCGAGKFGGALKERQRAEVWGNELDPACASEARSRLDRVVTGDIASALQGLPDGYFDCVVFNDVLEHLANPYRVLEQVKHKMSSGGIVVCSIPNVRFFYVLRDYLLGKDWLYRDSGVLDKTHLRFFTKKSIVDMFEALGYEVERIEGINGIRTRAFEAFDLITMGFFSDTRFAQFACLARPRPEGITSR